MTTKKIPSCVPYYIVGIFWFLWALLFPMYKLVHFFILGILSAAFFLIAKKLFPGQAVVVEEPVNTGDKDLDLLISQAASNIQEIRNLNVSIKEKAISMKISELEVIANNILEVIKKEPRKINQVQTFLNYYLPTTIKLLTSYDELGKQRSVGKNIKESLKQIEGIMDQIIATFQKELDNLFEGKAIDINAEITILESMMNQKPF